MPLTSEEKANIANTVAACVVTGIISLLVGLCVGAVAAINTYRDAAFSRGYAHYETNGITGAVEWRWNDEGTDHE